MKTIGHILARYTAWILHVLAPLGIWGVFAIAFADSALLGMPVDAIVAYYVYQDHRKLLFYVVMASLGSVIGSIPLYVIGYLGGEKVLRWFETEVKTATGEVIARVRKQLYVRLKPKAR